MTIKIGKFFELELGFFEMYLKLGSKDFYYNSTD